MEKGRNSFEVFCDGLERSYNNSHMLKVKFVRNKLCLLSQDMLIQMKAEAEEDDIKDYNSNNMAYLALLISIIFPMSELIPEIAESIKSEKGIALGFGWFLIGLILALLIVIVITLFKMLHKQKKNKSIIGWRKYFLAVIDEYIIK